MQEPQSGNNGKPFYSGGLRFQCTRCSRCCRFTPGYVFLSEKDLRRIARYLRLSWGEALRLYCRVVRLGHFSRISLKEKPNLDCIFWKDGSCSLYQARPLQCRSYPFWSSNLHSPQAWESAGKSCPGIGTGTFYSRREIEAWLRRREHEALISVDDEYLPGKCR